jgi:hypothetical protein
MGFFLVWAAICVIVNLTIIGFLGWAVYKIVKHITK